MLITFPIQTQVNVDVHKLIQHCDSTQLHEIILLAERKLNQMKEFTEFDEIIANNEKKLAENKKLMNKNL